MLTSPKVPSDDRTRKDAFLVVARYIHAKAGTKSDFPLYTVICDSPDEAIEFVLDQGFALSKGEWSLRAIHVALVAGQAG